MQDRFLLYEAPLGMSDHVCLIWDYVIEVVEMEVNIRNSITGRDTIIK